MTEPMTDRNAQALDILARLGAQPATSFREDGVAGVVQTILAELNVEYRVDDYGNIIAHRPATGVSSTEPGNIPPIAFMAHLDHPGFEAVAVDGDFLVGTAMGGVPPSAFESGVRLQVLLPDGQRWGAVTAGPAGESAERKALISLDDPARLSELSLPGLGGVRPGGL